MPVESNGRHLADDIFKNVYEFLNLRALIISTFYKSIIFQCIGKIFGVEFQRDSEIPHKISYPYI